MKNLIISFLSIILISFSCSVIKQKRRERRADRKISKAKELHPDRFLSDTIKLVDTIVINKVTHDTVSRLIRHDSVIVINNERLKIKYFYNPDTDSIHHDVEEKGDTLILERIVVVEKIIEKDPSNEWLYKVYFLGFISSMMAILLILFLIRRRNKKK